MMREFTEVVAEINTFPTATDIADHLRSKGVTGDKSSCISCPIAQHLDAEVGEPIAFVYLDIVETSEYGVHQLSLAVQSFIRQFDDGEYPELIA